MGKHLKLSAFILALVLSGASSAEDLRNLDVSGRNGQNGRNGTDRSGSASSDTNGADGGHAGPAEAGQKSGDINVSFKSGPNGTLILEGQFNPAGSGPQQVRETITIGKKGYIPLRANGGHGGAGGDGGNGQDGGRGSDGSNSYSQFSNGGNGNDGGRGGDGGKATSGEKAGAGGKINVRVTGDDTHLIMLALPEVRGGKGGKAGSNGRGGSGGAGGSGGSGYHWTETHETSSTDSEGNTTTSTYTTSHSTSDGSSGSRGSSGHNGNASVSKGADAPDGEYKITVDDGGGRKREYRQRYDMTIVDFQMHNDNGDSINEPGEKATIQKLRVRNTGGMPTPPNHPVTVYLGSSEWVVPQGVELKVPKSLAPGEEYVFDKEVLPFKIPDTNIVEKDKAFERADAARPLSFQAEVDRPYTNFDKPHHFTIQFPIKIEPVHAIETLAPGDAAKMEWKVTNISGRDFGGASDLKREVATRLGMANHGEMGKNIVLMDSEGKPIDWNKGLLQEISNLKAGQSTNIKGMMGVLPGAESYASAQMQVDLQLGQIEAPGTRRAVQQNTYPVRIGEKYQKTPNSDILLVTNHGTTQEEIKAWRDLAKRSGKTLDVWDISLNNFLDLDRSVTKGPNLLEDFHGKTVVLLNNKFKTVDGEKHGDELMGQMDLIRATASHGIRFLVVNEGDHQIEGLMSSRLIPTDEEIEHGYKDLKTYLKGEPDASSEKGSQLILKDKFKQEAVGVDAKRKEVKVSPTDTTGQISIDGYRKPNEKRLAAQAAAAQKAIEARNPGSRVVVSYNVADEGATGPDFAKTKGWFGKYKHQGVLTVRPTVNDMQPNITVINVSAEKLHNANFIGGEGMNAALTQSFNFEDKLSALDKVLAELAVTPEGDPQFEARHALGKKLVDGLLVDLAVEQSSVLRPGWKSGVSADTLTKSMAYLNRIGTYQTSLDLSKPSPAADLMADLVAGIRFLGNNQARWYERMPFPWSPFRRGPAVRSQTGKMADQLETQMFGPAASHGEALKKRLVDRTEELTKRRNELYAEKKKGPKDGRLTVKQSATETVMEPLLGENATMDALYTFDRVLAEGEWKAIHDGEVTIENGRRELQAAKEQQKGDYLVVSEGQVTNPAHAACTLNFVELVKAAKVAGNQLVRK